MSSQSVIPRNQVRPRSRQLDPDTEVDTIVEAFVSGLESWERPFKRDEFASDSPTTKFHEGEESWKRPIKKKSGA